MALGPALIFLQMSKSLKLHLVSVLESGAADSDIADRVVAMLSTAIARRRAVGPPTRVAKVIVQALMKPGNLNAAVAVATRTLDHEWFQAEMIRASKDVFSFSAVFLVYAEHRKTALMRESVSMFSKGPVRRRLWDRETTRRAVYCWTRDLIRAPWVSADILKSFDECARDQGVTIPWSDRGVIQAALNSKSASGVEFLLRQNVAITVSAVRESLSVDTGVSEPYKFLMAIRYISANEPFDTNCKSPSRLVALKRMYVVENFLLPENISTSFRRAIRRVNPNNSPAEARAIINRVFDEGQCKIAELCESVFNNILINQNLSAMSLLSPSFRVFVSVMREIQTSGHYLMLRNLCPTDTRGVLVDEFREGRYCTKDPGFLVMLWCTASVPGRRRRLPPELTKMVFEFEFAFVG